MPEIALFLTVFEINNVFYFQQMATEIGKIFNFSKAIREWPLVPSTVQNCMKSLEISNSHQQVGEQNIHKKCKFYGIEVTSDLVIGKMSK